MKTRQALAPTIALTLAVVLPAAAEAAGKTKFWNLTAETITDLRLAPAGSAAFGPNLTAADKDGTADHDETMKLSGIASGRYDVKFTDAKGRICVVPDVQVTAGETFSVDENELPAACRK